MGINVDSRVLVGSASVASPSADIEVDIGAGPFIARAHPCAAVTVFALCRAFFFILSSGTGTLRASISAAGALFPPPSWPPTPGPLSSLFCTFRTSVDERRRRAGKGDADVNVKGYGYTAGGCQDLFNALPASEPIVKRPSRSAKAPHRRGLRGRQGSVEPRKDCGVAPRIVHDHQPLAQPEGRDAFRDLCADARSLISVAD